MIGIYRDSGLTLRVSLASPKRFLLPLKGGTKTSTLYLGDPYTATVTSTATAGASTINVDQTFEFLASGHAVFGSQNITYTGVTATSLTGVTGITSTINPGDKIRPNKVWNTSGQVTFVPAGADLGNGILVSLNNGAGSYNFPGTPLILGATQVTSGVSNALPLGIQVQVGAGVEKELVDWGVVSGNFYARDSASVTAPANGENGVVARLFGYVYRQDQALKQWVRILPVGRKVSSSSPGFKIGEYRWKDELNSNAVPLLDTKWDPDISLVGPEKFTTGMGHGSDLEPVDVESTDSSIRMRINPGHYFTGPERNYLPATPVLEFHSASVGGLSFTLAQPPQRLTPLFVGTYQLDSQGYYSHANEYHYQATGFDVSAGAPVYQYIINRKTGFITLNQAVPKTLIFLGILSGQANDYFDMSLYPVARVNRVFIDRGLGIAPATSPSANIIFDQSLGTIQLTDPAGIGPTIPTGLKGEAVFAECEAAVAVLYSAGTAVDRLIDTVDINPASAGISSGHFYLQHRRQKPNSIVLAVDKPQIDIPPTLSSIVGLTAFGPVYFENDFALLRATCYSKVPGETIPNARLQAVVDSNNFSGLLNYVNPLTQPVQVLTGGDGSANLIYTPTTGFGVWVPTIAAQTPITAVSLAGIATTTIAGDTLVLPATVPISQVRNSLEGWLVTTYLVYNNNPLFGKTGADPNQGEIAFQTSGTAGSTAYKTNGMRDAWRSGSLLVFPIKAFDITGKNYTDVGFNGNVKYLQFAAAIPSGGTIGSYFVSYLQRVTIQLSLVNSNIVSNTIALQMQVPPVIVENPWLILQNATQGRLNQYRLGWVRPANTTPTRTL
jgi:hypothetical protein